MAYNSYQSAIIPNPGSSSGSGTRFQLEDTTFTKVFVGGLAWETQSHTLRRHFEQFGDILEAVVITDKNTARSKGYGFVTYVDPESARQACVDPSPIIDGRRTNCNLASLGRPNPSLAYGRMMPVSPSFGSLHTPRSAYGGSPGYRPISYSYQPGSTYPPYGYTSYGPEYVYPQGGYNPYVGQQYMPIYGVPGMYPYGQWRQPVPGGQGYSGHQGFAMSGHHIMQVGRPNMNGTSPTNFSTFQAPYAVGVASPNSGQPPIILRAPPPPPQIAQDNSSDQMEPLDCSSTRSIRDPTSVTGLLSSIASYCLCILEVVTVHGHGFNKNN